MKSNPLQHKLDLQLFAEDPTTQSQDQKEEKGPTTDIDLEAIKKLKENSVPKEKYEKLEEQYKKAVNDIINGDVSKPVVSEKEKPKFEELVSKIANVGSKPLTNLEFWETALELREQAMQRGLPDPLLAVGRKVEAPTQADYDEAEATAAAFKECIEKADNDPIIFNQELKRRGLK